MNIFEFAMEQEQSSENFYRRLADKTAVTGLKNICTMLAVEEQRHYHIVRDMRDQIPPKVAQTSILEDSRRVFEKMRRPPEYFSGETTELQLYQKARDIEEQARKFYLEKAEETQDHCHKGVFRILAGEELKHQTILEHICEFVSKPQRYLENAEFTHLADYADGAF